MSSDRFKFRVWDNINKRYVKDMHFRLDGVICYDDGHPYCNGEHQDDFTIEQCTGLKDKNGKMIYEGDVLVFVNGATHPIIVTWDGIGWKFIRNGKRIEDAFECNTINHISMCEIIGNIHKMELKK